LNKPLNHFEPIGFDPAKASEAMRARGLSVVVLTSPENVYYTTGYTTLPSAGNPILYMLRNRLPYFSVLTADGRVRLLCWAFSTWQMEFGVDEVVGFNNLQEGVEALEKVLGGIALPGTSLAVESTCPYYVLKAIKGLSEVGKPKLADALMDDLRLIKTDAEVACLRKSLAIIEKTCGELFGTLYVGMGRNELTREAKTRLMRNGCDGISHITFSFAQANPEFDIDEKLETGKLVTLDLGAIYRGYCSDNRRYAYAGKAPAVLDDTYQQMVEIVDSVGAALIPGTTYQDLMDLARRLYAEKNVKPLGRFNHVGHNIGLETEERWLDDDRYAVVRAGMVINIELYTTASNGTQIGDEETYIIEASGPRRISALPRKIREID
jgi:Xaa-Pro aminopeptidase